jgi:hypothetical protein
MRSSLVQGSDITQKELGKWLAAVSSVPEGRSPRMRIELAVDRLRISFAARSCCGCFSTATAATAGGLLSRPLR